MGVGTRRLNILEQRVISRLQAFGIPVKTQAVVVKMFKELFCRSLNRLGDYMETCVDIVCSQITDDHNMPDTILAGANKTILEGEEYVLKCRNYNMDALKNGLDSQKSNNVNLSKDLLPSYAIQRNFALLRTDLFIQESYILEQLLADNVLNDSDKESIVNKPTSREQNEEFLKRVRDKCNFDQFKKIVLPALKKDHSHLEQALQTTLAELVNNPESGVTEKCGWCLIQSFVEPRRLADDLLNKKAISQNFYSDLRNVHSSNSVKWEQILKNVPNSYFIESAIRAEYPSIVQQVLDSGGFITQCTCPHDGYDSSENSPPSDIARLSDVRSLSSDNDARISANGLSGSYTMPSRRRKIAFNPDTEKTSGVYRNPVPQGLRSIKRKRMCELSASTPHLLNDISLFQQSSLKIAYRRPPQMLLGMIKLQLCARNEPIPIRSLPDDNIINML